MISRIETAIPQQVDDATVPGAGCPVSEDNPYVMAGLREGGWDVRVVFVERRQRWWWNAWRAATSTELYGFADSRTDAWLAMNRAIGAR